jgi:hypothetical protein
MAFERFIFDGDRGGQGADGWWSRSEGVESAEGACSRRRDRKGRRCNGVDGGHAGVDAREGRSRCMLPLSCERSRHRGPLKNNKQKLGSTKAKIERNILLGF